MTVRPKAFFPWASVDAARADARLQRLNSLDEARSHYLLSARPCPSCQRHPGELAWFYFAVDPARWNPRSDAGGWITVCDDCRVQVNFFGEEPADDGAAPGALCAE